ncbi:MAG: HNH endonuclease, partial [Candidatus Dormibacteria bacterium]
TQVRNALSESDPKKMLAKVPDFDPKQPPLLFAKARLPISDGHGVGTRGTGLWYSNKAEVKAITGGQGIPYRNNYPVFQKWAKQIVEIDFSQGGHAVQADKALAKQIVKKHLEAEFPAEFFTSRGKQLPKGKCNLDAMKEWRIQNRLTWHHHQGIGEQMLLLPRDLHANVPHTGGHAISKGTHSL